MTRDRDRSFLDDMAALAAALDAAGVLNPSGYAVEPSRAGVAVVAHEDDQAGDEDDPIEATIEFHDGDPVSATVEYHEVRPPKRRGRVSSRGKRRTRSARAASERATPPPASGPSMADLLGATLGAMFVGAAIGIGARVVADRIASQRKAPHGRRPLSEQDIREVIERARAAAKREAPPPPPRDPNDEADRAAAALLGVPVDASETQIRARWRELVRSKLAGEGFHDQGGDHETTSAYVTAKNRLIERARQRAGRR